MSQVFGVKKDMGRGKAMKKKGKKGFVFQIWRSFILFILIPVVLLNAAIFYMLHDMENTTKGMAKTRLVRAQFLLNQNIEDSLVTVNRIGSNYGIQKMSVFQEDLKPEDYGTIWETKEFKESMVTANDAYSINILCNGSDIFMTENNLCMDLKQFYHKSYEFGQVPMEKLKERGHRGSRITFYPYSRYKNGEVERNGIFYTTVLTPYAGEDTGATAVVFLNEENLLGILGDFSVWNGLTYIMDADGQILYQTGNGKLRPVTFPVDTVSDDVQILSGDMFGNDTFAMTAGVTTGLRIVSVISSQDLFMQMGSLRIFIWILNGTSIFMCLWLSLILAKRRSKILSNTLELMDRRDIGQKNVFSALYNSVSDMVDTNASLKDALGAQSELLRSVFWSRALSVNTMTDSEMRRLAESAGIASEAAGYCLILVGFGIENDAGAQYWNLLLQKRKQVQEELEQDLSLGGYVGNSGIDQLVLLFPLDENQSQDYQSYITERTQSLKQLMNQDAALLCIGSAVFQNLCDIYSAYASCGNQMNLCGTYLESREIIWCMEEKMGTETTFYYTDELKNQIVLWIKSGQEERVKEGFLRILEENYLKRRISGTVEPLLIAKLKLTLLGAYDSRMTVDMAEVFERVDKIQTDAWLFSYILRVALDMCGYYMAGIRSHEEGLQKKIVNYIEKHFSEYGFGLSSVAGYCNLSETYFSQIFKEVIGENFSTYVEKKRMNYAYQLVVESNLTIDAVAEKTGYGNTNAFRKAYKRFYGLSPSQSRKNKVST